MSTLYLTRTKGQPIAFRLPDGQWITVTWEKGEDPNHRFKVTAPAGVEIEYLSDNATPEPNVVCRGVGPKIVKR